MSDLINRSELYMNDLIRRKDVLALFPTNDCSDKMVGLYERVLDIPTAYDVEKVVEELGNLDTKAIDRYKGGAFGDWEGTDYFIDKYDAIEIVKAGRW